MSFKKESEWLEAGLQQKWVYVAGPVTKGNWMHNLRNAIDAGEKLIKNGFLPVIPHTSMLLELINPHHSYEVMLYRLTLPLISRCDYVLRIPGESAGADKEVEFANSRGIPVYFSIGIFLNEESSKGIDKVWS